MSGERRAKGEERAQVRPIRLKAGLGAASSGIKAQVRAAVASWRPRRRRRRRAPRFQRTRVPPPPQNAAGVETIARSNHAESRSPVKLVVV